MTPLEDNERRPRRRQDEDLFVPIDQRVPTTVWFIAAALALAFLAIMIFRAATTPPDTTPLPSPTTGVPGSPSSFAPGWQITVAAEA